MDKISFAERARYRFDNIMARGTVALIGLLALVTVAFIAVMAAIVAVFGIGPGDEEMSFPEAMWASLMRTLDSGTMGGDEGAGFRTAMLVVTIGGVIVVASLIGIISGAFDAKVEQLRKGHSRVLESDHTLILGWSSKVFPIVSELIIANESRRKAVIVIVADRDKVEMDDEIRAHFPRSGSTRIICRSGDPMSLGDLEMGSPHAARSIVVLAPDDAADPDSVVIKTTLALTNNPRRGEKRFHIVGEIQDAGNLEAARLVGRDEAHWVLAQQLISRITVQSCRQSGLSVVYQDLLDFDGDEIYFTEQPVLVGRDYASVQFAFESCTVIGMVKGGEVLLNPAHDIRYDGGDQLNVIAEDDSVIALSADGSPQTDAISPAVAVEQPAEHTLVLGYNDGLHALLRELSEYVESGSTVTLVADVRPPVLEGFSAMPVDFRAGDTTSRALLDSLDVTRFSHIIVLPYQHLDPQQADARTLITLLHLRDIAESIGGDLNVVSEMIDDRNRELAEVTQADDFIVSDKLISLLLSQVSENQKLAEVFDTLFSSGGSEVYLRPAEAYVTAGASVDFYTVVEAAARRGETAIGYRVHAHARDAASGYGVHLNPRKTAPVSFSAGDRVIVLAES
jgi:voltage-gated potassium channel Kch